jgi:hypothetical protein
MLRCNALIRCYIYSISYDVKENLLSALRLIAGPTAFKAISEHGLNPELFSQILAASGGPKWLSIAGLDKYLFSEFFKDRTTPLYTLGASSGAWRLACFAQEDPLAAYQRLEKFYIGQRYENRPSPIAVTEQVQDVIRAILGPKAGQDIVDNRVIRSHFVVCRARHLNRSNHRLALAAGLATTAMTNMFSRRSLGWHFERVVLGHQDPHSPFGALKDLPTHQALLNKQNLSQALLASGSIPLLLAPVKQIQGLAAGHYYDGGLTDYHFDLKLPKGLTLYPHFYPHMSPGWFDKSLGWRKAKANYHNALILAPSSEHIANLPFGKIPDREDFSTMSSVSRMTYWREAVKWSESLADEFAKLMASGNIMQKLERL